LITTWMVPVITKSGYHWFFTMGALMVPLSWFCITFITGKQTNQNRPASKQSL
jgi:MFS transporter, ACS family, hexuronate transporter